MAAGGASADFNMDSPAIQPPAAGMTAAQIAKALGLSTVEQKQAEAAGPGPCKAPKPRQSFSVRSLLLYRHISAVSRHVSR